MRGQDLLTALADELQGLAPRALVREFDAGTTPDAVARERADHAYVTAVTRLSEAAGYMGLGGVQRIAACVLDNLAHINSDDHDARIAGAPVLHRLGAARRSAPARRRVFRPHRIADFAISAAAGYPCRSTKRPGGPAFRARRRALDRRRARRERLGRARSR